MDRGRQCGRALGTSLQRQRPRSCCNAVLGAFSKEECVAGSVSQMGRKMRRTTRRQRDVCERDEAAFSVRVCGLWCRAIVQREHLVGQRRWAASDDGCSMPRPRAQPASGPDRRVGEEPFFCLSGPTGSWRVTCRYRYCGDITMPTITLPSFKRRKQPEGPNPRDAPELLGRQGAATAMRPPQSTREPQISESRFQVNFSRQFTSPK
jgi:hypothetical protein